MKQKLARAIIVAGYAVVIYAILAVNIYRLSNPSLTETELFLRIPDALMLR